MYVAHSDHISKQFNQLLERQLNQTNEIMKLQKENLTRPVNMPTQPSPFQMNKNTGNNDKLEQKQIGSSKVLKHITASDNPIDKTNSTDVVAFNPASKKTDSSGSRTPYVETTSKFYVDLNDQEQNPGSFVDRTAFYTKFPKKEVDNLKNGDNDASNKNVDSISTANAVNNKLSFNNK